MSWFVLVVGILHYCGCKSKNFYRFVDVYTGNNVQFLHASICKAAVSLNPQGLSLCYPCVSKTHHLSNP